MKIRNVENKVRVVLENHPPSRDDDMILYSCIVGNVFGKRRSEEMNGWEMLQMIYRTKVPHFTSVLRCRQKLQERNKDLRGKKYETRTKQYKEDVRVEMRDWDQQEQKKLF